MSTSQTVDLQSRCDLLRSLQRPVVATTSGGVAATLGYEDHVARVSWGPFLYREAIARFEAQLASLQD
jgi:2-methylisocitrate lyase-like PEP mutase family enzyme